MIKELMPAFISLIVAGVFIGVGVILLTFTSHTGLGSALSTIGVVAYCIAIEMWLRWGRKIRAEIDGYIHQIRRHIGGGDAS